MFQCLAKIASKFLIISGTIIPAFSQNQTVTDTVSKQSTLKHYRLVEEYKPQSYNQRNFEIKHLLVKAGDSISISANVYETKQQKGRFWKSLAKAVVPSLVTQHLSNQIPEESTSDSRKSVSNISAGVLVTPSIIELAPIAIKNEKPYIEIKAYDSTNNEVFNKKSIVNKIIKEENSELIVTYKAEKDGFVDITTSSGNKTSTQLLINAVRHSIDLNNLPVADSLTSGSIPGARACVGYFWEISIGGVIVSSTLLFTSGCGEDVVISSSGGDGSLSSSGWSQNGNDGETQGCLKCKAAAYKAREAKRRYEIFQFLSFASVVCHLEGAAAGVGTAAAGSLVSLALPGIGQGALAIVSTLVGIGTDIYCLLDHALKLDSELKSADSNFYSALVGCGDCFYEK